ncbi:hypothetical protein ACFLYZ_01110 [Thermodesulfobacteriota bacterium]
MIKDLVLKSISAVRLEGTRLKADIMHFKMLNCASEFLSLFSTAKKAARLMGSVNRLWGRPFDYNFASTIFSYDGHWEGRERGVKALYTLIIL